MAHGQRRLIGLLAAGSLAAAGFAAPATAVAAGSLITVTTLYDGGTTGDGACSLREAIVSANANIDNTNDDCTDGQSGEPDQIQFVDDGTVLLTSSLPAITDSVWIDGHGSIEIDGQDSYTPFTVVGSLTLSDLVVQNGFGTSGGAVANGGSVTIIGSTIRSSSAFDGGGIHNYGSMTIIASTIESNEATDAGGGIFNEGSITLENVTLAGNRAGVGAALSQSTGESTLRHVTVSLNVSDNARRPSERRHDEHLQLDRGGQQRWRDIGRHDHQPQPSPGLLRWSARSRRAAMTMAGAPRRSGWSAVRTPR